MGRRCCEYGDLNGEGMPAPKRKRDAHSAEQMKWYVGEIFLVLIQVKSSNIIEIVHGRVLPFQGLFCPPSGGFIARLCVRFVTLDIWAALCVVFALQ